MAEHTFTGAAMVNWTADDEGNILSLAVTTLDDPEQNEEYERVRTSPYDAEAFDREQDVLAQMIPNMDAWLTEAATALPEGLSINLG